MTITAEKMKILNRLETAENKGKLGTMLRKIGEKVKNKHGENPTDVIRKSREDRHVSG